MREIKFRGKRVDGGEWIFGCVYYYNDKAFISRWGFGPDPDHLTRMQDDWDEVIPETVGQFTGLKDKNGVEIYEGDESRKNNEVRFYEGAFWVFTNGKEDMLLYDCVEIGFEITGSIHDEKEVGE